jgi:hypothetical protein
MWIRQLAGISIETYLYVIKCPDIVKCEITEILYEIYVIPHDTLVVCIVMYLYVTSKWIIFA